jgi:hypothetical protein
MVSAARIDQLKRRGLVVSSRNKLVKLRHYLIRYTTFTLLLGAVRFLTRFLRPSR